MMPIHLSVTQLKQDRAELLDEMEAIVDGGSSRHLTHADQAKFDAKIKAIDKIDKDLRSAERNYERVNKYKSHGQPQPQLDDLGLGGSTTPRIEGLPRHQPVKNFRGVRNGKPAEERCYEFGHWALSQISQHCPAHAGHFQTSTQICEDRGIYNVAQTGSNDNAGVFIPEQFGMDLVVLRENFGIARQVSEIVQMDSDTRSDPKWTSGLTAFFVGESSAGTESDANWENLKLTAKDIMVLTRMSSQLSADAAINYGDTLLREIAYAFSNLEDTVTFNGDGGSTHGGIIGLRTRLKNVDGEDTDSFGLNTQDSGNTWGAIDINDFHDTIGLCPEYSLMRNPIWVCNTLFYHTVMTPLAIAQAGGATISEAGTAVGGAATSRQFLGFPVVFSQIYPTATAVSTVSCSFGDHQMGIRFGDRQQESILFSEHASVGGQSVFERNQIAVRGTERLDVVVHGYGDATTAGPIVGLQTGA